MNSFAEHWIQIVKAHERLIIIGISTLSLAYGTQRVLRAWEAHDQRVFQGSQAVLQATIARNESQSQADAILSSQYADLAKQVLAQNAQLEAQITKRDAQVKTQQAQDATLAPPDLIVRWEGLAQLPVGSVTSGSGSFQITEPGARQTVQALEVLPALKQDLKDTQAQLVGEQAQVAKQTDVVSGLRTELTGKDTQLVEQAKACNDQVNLVKSQARKGKLKWFAGGYVAGLLTRGIVKIFTGV